MSLSYIAGKIHVAMDNIFTGLTGMEPTMNNICMVCLDMCFILFIIAGILAFIQRRVFNSLSPEEKERVRRELLKDEDRY